MTTESTTDGPSRPAGTNPIGAWLQLVRLPNVFTVLADVGAAFLLVGGDQPGLRLAVVLAAGVALYWAGMILNDVFDVEKDRAERSNRPIPSGAISAAAAAKAGWGCLVVGIVLSAASGYVPDGDSPSTWFPAAIGVSLAVMIVAYDGPLKKTPFAPAAMGGCRGLSFLLGASPRVPLVDGLPEVPRYVVAVAMGFGVYVMGITTFARDEAAGGHRMNLQTGLVVMLLGGLMLAFAPVVARPGDRAGWHLGSGGQYTVLILLIMMPIALRGFRAISDPQPAVVGNTIRASILTIIPLSAAFAFLGAGQFWGLAVFSLVLPAIVLAAKLRVT